MVGPACGGLLPLPLLPRFGMAHSASFHCGLLGERGERRGQAQRDERRASSEQPRHASSAGGRQAGVPALRGATDAVRSRATIPASGFPCRSYVRAERGSLGVKW